MSKPVPDVDLWPLALAKEDARCCMDQVDAHGRPPIGFCGPDCERRRRIGLIRDCIRSVRAPRPRMFSVSIDARPGWESWSSVWDDPTADAALGADHP